MAELTLTKTRIQAGIYEATLKSDHSEKPEIKATFLEQPLGELDISQDPEADQTWNVRLSLPADMLTDGIQTVVLSDAATDQTLDSFTIVTGEPLSDDIRAEIELLRAELDMLKQAFRRHCVETA